MIIIYEHQRRFDDQAANQLASDLVRACEAVGTVTRNKLDIRSPSPGPYHRNIHQPSASAY